MPTSPLPRLRDRLATAGRLPFAAFMEEALYGEGGYYRQGELAIGPGGDYVTGSSLSPLFGRVTARLLRRLDGTLGKAADYLEVGHGTGAHLEAVVAALREDPPARGAASRRILAWDRVARPLPPGIEREVERPADVDALAGGLIGLVFSYELFDALPVHRLIGRADGTVGELWVTLDPAGDFAWAEGELSAPDLAGLLAGERLAPGQVADLAPGWAPLYRQLARALARGCLVTCDYGYRRPQLLDARVRPWGTLACHRRHRLHRNPFVAVGEQDLTAHVDLDALVAAGEVEGLTTLALTRQAPWLAACGLFDELAGADLATRVAAMALLDGEGMGEEIRVLVQARGVRAEDVLPPELRG